MKTFTYPQKKWVMTGALLAVLGINVSFNSHKYGIASADFASLSDGVVEGKIPTAKGIIPVKYIDNGEDKVLAIVPKKLTQGKVCEDCGFESISLNVKNKKDIDALNVELLNVISKTKDTVLTASESTTEKKTEAEAEKPKKDFFAGLDKCDDKKSNSATLTCRTNGFLKILKVNAKAIDTEDAHNYYKENIENLIKIEITESRRMINRQRRAAAMQGNSSFFHDEDVAADPAEIRDKALSQIRNLISGIPGKFESIRKRLITAETEIAKAEALELQQTFIQARDSKDPALGTYLFQEGNFRRIDLSKMMNDMLNDTRSGLEGVSSNELNASLKNQYMDFLNEYLVKINAGMNTDIYKFMGSDNGNTTLPGVNFSGRIQNPRRSSGTVVVPSNLSNRTGNRINF